jgi:hypothetical protein
MPVNSPTQPAIPTVVVRPTGGPVAEEVLDSIVHELNDIYRASTMEIHLRIGRLIVTKLYGGDTTAWRKHGAKETSFQKLAHRTDRDLLVSASSLYRAVALYELTERVGISSWKYLGVSHLRTVFGLPDPEQRRLLVLADRERWAVSRLWSEAAKLRAADTEKTRRRRLPPFAKSLHRIERLALPKHAFAGLDHTERLLDDEVVRLQRIVSEVREHLDAVARRLDARAATLAGGIESCAAGKAKKPR